MSNHRPWIGKRINDLREIRGETLQQVADACGTSKSHIHEIESNHTHDPRVSTILALCKHFNITPDWLLLR